MPAPRNRFQECCGIFDAAIRDSFDSLSLFAINRDLLVNAMSQDLELLRSYAVDGAEDAFRAILDRHIGLVYSAALRQVRDPHVAQEVTQAVFVVLARKAGSLRDGTVLAGWLFRTTRFVAARALRDEQLRQRREQEAVQMETYEASATESSWDEIAPVLDEALARLGETDRNAVLLRFFEKKPLKEVGETIGATEEAAKKRVARALEKLRTLLVRRGVVLSTMTLAGVLAENSVHAAPVEVITSTFGVAMANAKGATGLALVKAALKTIFYAKCQAAVVLAALFIAVVGSGTIAAQKFSRPIDFTESDSVSIRLGAGEFGDGLTHLDSVFDGQTTIETINGVRCRYLKLIGNRTTLYFYFLIDPGFKQKDVRNVRIEVEYFDRAPGALGVHYDPEVPRAKIDPSYQEANWPVVLTGSQRWNKAVFRIRDGGFRNSQNGDADFRVWAKTTELYIRRVTMTRETEAAIVTGQ
jgi:RNA polymerase sigma factor (sigma-70 family)